MSDDTLTDKQERFCLEYLVDFNATQASIRAGYSPKTAGAIGSENLKKPNIIARLSVMQEEARSRFNADADDVVRMWWETATADPNELVSHRIGACRYCWGRDHLYQWRTEIEMLNAQNAFDAKYPAVNGVYEPNRPVEDGGYNYRATYPIHPDCPMCDGLGEPYVIFGDTTKLSPQGRLLYNGVKQTRQGKEMVIADRQKAMEHVARRLGLMNVDLTLGVTDPFMQMIQGIITEGSTAPIQSSPTQAIPSRLLDTDE